MTDPQHGHLSLPWSGIVVLGNSLPLGQAVVSAGVPPQATTRKMRPELERFIDRVVVPILVQRYIERFKRKGQMISGAIR